MIKYDPDSRYYFSTLINGDGVEGGFATKFAGNGRNVQQIREFLIEEDIDSQCIVTPEQVHSANIAAVNKKPETNILAPVETDGVITTLEKIVLTIIAADCVPILYRDTKTGTVAISHQGWRGTLKRLPQKMINKLKEAGSKPRNIVAAIGPAIGECCYNVEDERYYEFRDEMGEAMTAKVFSTKHGQKHLNLTHLNYLLLKEAGIERIDHFPFCTHCNKGMFFSHRRKDKERQFSFIVHG